MAKLATTSTQLGASAQGREANTVHPWGPLPFPQTPLGVVGTAVPSGTCQHVHVAAATPLRISDTANGPAGASWKLTVEAVQHFARHAVSERRVAGHGGGKVEAKGAGDRNHGGLTGSRGGWEAWVGGWEKIGKANGYLDSSVAHADLLIGLHS